MAGLKLQTKSADKILYGIKFPWDDKATLIKMLGLQAASSTTNTRASSAVNLKQGVYVSVKFVNYLCSYYI
ncbi:prophage Lp2 protein 45 [Lactiplantibacillus plantarum]|nr:prophage Lp2 protein 45 [Lactiplantibacillus plantarum]